MMCLKNNWISHKMILGRITLFCEVTLDKYSVLKINILFYKYDLKYL